MKDHTDHIVFFRELPPEQAERLAAVVASDPEAARAFELWRDLRDDLARRLDEAAGDRELFALFVLSEYGRGAMLSEAERSRVDRVAPKLREAIARHPGLSGAADDIDSAAEEFSTTWDAWFGDDAATETPRQDASPHRRDRSPRSRPKRLTARVTIGAAVVAFAALLVFVLQRDHGMITAETAEGEMRTVELGGGSTVRLVGESRLSYTPPGDVAPIGRQVVLEGRGFFDIVPDGHGLVIKTEQAQVTVLGTSFGVRAVDRTTEVVLADGRLSFAPLGDPARSIVLEPGQMSRVAADGVPTSPEAVSVHEQLAWTGLFVFSAAPLQSILGELQLHYNVEVTASPELAEEQVTGRFERGQELDGILQTLAAAVGAEVQQLPEGGFRLSE